MNNNFYDIPLDWYNEFNNNFVNTNKSNDNIELKEGYLRGNIFSNLYDPYKNYKYEELTPKNKLEELLLNILKYKFALVELDLYLDLHPEDRNTIELYKKYLNEEKNLCNTFEKEYGPLTLDYMYLTDKWNWIKSPWPWEGIK